MASVGLLTVAMALLLILDWGFAAAFVEAERPERRRAWGKLPENAIITPTGLYNKQNFRPPTPWGLSRMHFRKLPKGTLVPPIGPSLPPTALGLHERMHFGKLPEGTPMPPSGSSTPPMAFDLYERMHSRKLTKGTPMTPSETSSPPRPLELYGRMHFGKLPKDTPGPSSGPSGPVHPGCPPHLGLLLNRNNVGEK